MWSTTAYKVPGKNINVEKKRDKLDGHSFNKKQKNECKGKMIVDRREQSPWCMVVAL